MNSDSYFASHTILSLKFRPVDVWENVLLIQSFLSHYFYVLIFESTWLTKATISIWEVKAIYNIQTPQSNLAKKNIQAFVLVTYFLQTQHFSKGSSLWSTRFFQWSLRLYSLMLDLLIDEMLTGVICFKSSSVPQKTCPVNCWEIAHV